MNLYDPAQWANPSGLAIVVAVMAMSLLLAVTKLAGEHWDDWLDERSGRGSIRDRWRN